MAPLVAYFVRAEWQPAFWIFPTYWPAKLFWTLQIRWQHVLFWGGLRGSLSIALALSLPLSLPYRTEMTMLVFGAVVFSLLAQGLTVAPLLKLLGLTERETESLEYEVLQGRLLAETAALAELDSLRQRGLIAAQVCDDLKAELTATQQTLSERLTSMGGAQRLVRRSHLGRRCR